MNKAVFDIDPALSRACITYKGELSAQGVIDTFETLADHCDWRPEFARLYIYGDDVKMGVFNPEDRTRLSTYRTEVLPQRLQNKSARVAHVCSDPVKRTFLHFWIDILGEASVDRVRIFADIDEAERWLAEASVNAA